jgi:RNA polymerase sigma-70 factor (ECF subfamily)
MTEIKSLPIVHRPGAVRRDIAGQLPAMRQFARRLVGSHGDPDDLVQETVMRALGAEDQFKPGTALKSWLFTIMRNTFCTAYQKQKREQVGFGEDVSNRLSIFAPQEWTVQQAEMRKALDRLPEHYRQSLVLVAMGTSYDETARMCRCRVGTVKSRVNRARKQLINEMGGASVH